MATSSITKDFYAVDKKAYEKLKKEYETPQSLWHAPVKPTRAAERGRELLATFKFR